MGFQILKGKIKFNRNELSASFGDIGTDFPLIVSMILICGLDPTSALVMFGLAQIFTGFFYKLPMPVQPLKAVAVIAISQKISGNIIYGAGLAIGLIMLVLTLTGLISWIAKTVPKSVIRGIQFGLGLKLSMLALGSYVPSEGTVGYILALISFVIIIFLLNNRRYPAALIVIGLGVVYALFAKIDGGLLMNSFGVNLPRIFVPSQTDILSGIFLLAIPQIALSIGNSILATEQLAKDYFPKEKISVEKISRTYSLLNITMPFLSGIPVCHGSGGMAGHYTFGGRTGGSVIIYGLIYLTLGLFFSTGFNEIIHLFPKSILGVILLFEGIALMKLIKDMMGSSKDLFLILTIAVIAAGLPYGFFIGLVGGTVAALLIKKGIIKVFE